MSEYASASTFISDERIADLESQGRQARRECRSRSPSLISKVEMKAFQSGWDSEQDFIERVVFSSAKIR